jgi:hypothetical protein
MVGGLVMRAVEDVRQVAGEVSVPCWWCLEYFPLKMASEFGGLAVCDIPRD